MTRLPTLRSKEVVAALKRGGFLEHHQKASSHLYLWHPVKRLMTTVAIHAKDLPRSVMKKILKQAGVSEEEFRRLL